MGSTPVALTQMIMMKNIWQSNLIWDNELPLNKMIETPSMIIIITAVFHESNKYYPIFFKWLFASIKDEEPN